MTKTRILTIDFYLPANFRNYLVHIFYVPISVISEEFSRNFRICIEYVLTADSKMRFIHSIIHNNPIILLRQITFLSLIIIVSNIRLLQANYDNICNYL